LRKKEGEMKLADHFQPGGQGVMATAAADGTVNTAIYAMPHVTGENTLAWGMTERLTYRNLRENPSASYLYIAPGNRYEGIRLTLKLKEIRDSGKLLDTIRGKTRESSGEGAANALKYVAFFEVVEERPLV
jgi:hypothetical protein